VHARRRRACSNLPTHNDSIAPPQTSSSSLDPFSQCASRQTGDNKWSVAVEIVGTGAATVINAGIIPVCLTLAALMCKSIAQTKRSNVSPFG
jgi:hypothetical protein